MSWVLLPKWVVENIDNLLHDVGQNVAGWPEIKEALKKPPIPSSVIETLEWEGQL